MKNILKPKTWSEVYECLFEDTFNPRIARYKSRYAYRGVSKASYELETSLMRLGGEYSKVEAHLIRQFKKYAHRFIDPKDNVWFWLSVGQHYGLPTRLLDWTYSPDVALHFTTVNTQHYDADGAVWKVNYKKVHQSLPKVLRAKAEEENTWILTVELLQEMFPKLDALDDSKRKNGEFVVFFEPPNLDDRIYNQFAYFSMGSSPELVMNRWLNSRPDMWQKVIIPKELKWEIRDKLDQRNISERTLFPGMGGLAEWLERYYLPTGKAKLSGPTAKPAKPLKTVLGKRRRVIK